MQCTTPVRFGRGAFWGSWGTHKTWTLGNRRVGSVAVGHQRSHFRLLSPRTPSGTKSDKGKWKSNFLLFLLTSHEYNSVLTSSSSGRTCCTILGEGFLLTFGKGCWTTHPGTRKKSQKRSHMILVSMWTRGSSGGQFSYDHKKSIDFSRTDQRAWVWPYLEKQLW